MGRGREGSPRLPLRPDRGRPELLRRLDALASRRRPDAAAAGPAGVRLMPSFSIPPAPPPESIGPWLHREEYMRRLARLCPRIPTPGLILGQRGELSGSDAARSPRP